MTTIINDDSEITLLTKKEFNAGASIRRNNILEDYIIPINFGMILMISCFLFACRPLNIATLFLFFFANLINACLTKLLSNFIFNNLPIEYRNEKWRSYLRVGVLMLIYGICYRMVIEISPILTN